MVGSSCCLSCGIAIAPKTSATIEISPIRALCARLNLDSQDMGGSLFCGLRGRWAGCRVAPGGQIQPTYTIADPRDESPRPQGRFLTPRIPQLEYAPAAQIGR